MWRRHRPHTVNRSVLIVRVKQPFIAWADSMGDGGPKADLREMRDDPNAYLVDNVECPDDLPAILDALWEMIFALELSSWMRDPTTWPKNISRNAFIEW